MPKAPAPAHWSVRIKTGTWRTDIENSAMILIGCTLVGLLFYVLGLSEANIITIYILGILVVSSITSVRIYGIISSVLGVLLFNCLFAEPRFTLFVFDPQYSITALIMLIASLITSSIMTLFRQQLDKEILETRRSEILLEINQHLLQTKNREEMLRAVLDKLDKVCAHHPALIPLEEGELSAPLFAADSAGQPFSVTEQEPWAQWLEQATPTDQPLASQCGGEKTLVYRIQSNKAVLALLTISQAEKEDLQSLLPSLLDGIAVSLEKELLRAATERIAHEAEAEHLRANLLRTISHDLRTPLTGIAGSADILLSNDEQIAPGMRRQMYQSIHDDAEWLIGVVENILFVTRLENGSMFIRLQPELLHEIIPEALQHLNKRGKNHYLELALPDELLMVKADAKMIMQVIINMVDNAVKYAPAGSRIMVRAFAREGQAVVEVADHGFGIADSDKAHIFEMFYTAGHDPGGGRGIGLGLPLCQSIIQAHGGEIYVRDNEPCGTIMGFSLPLEGLY